MFFAVRPSHFAFRHNFNKATLSPFRNKVGSFTLKMENPNPSTS